MQKLIFAFLLLLHSVAFASSDVFKALADAKLKKTAGRVFLSGAYHASGRFKCDDNFLSDGRIYFTLGSEDYSYKLSDVLVHPDVLRKKSLYEFRGLASEQKEAKWKVTRESYLEGTKISLVPEDNSLSIKKMNVILGKDKVLQSIYLDFGAYNLSFFGT